jgi:hypothetical protein
MAEEITEQCQLISDAEGTLPNFLVTWEALLLCIHKDKIHLST